MPEQRLLSRLKSRLRSSGLASIVLCGLIVPSGLLHAGENDTTAIVDLELPGTARGFILLWSLGYGAETQGLATDSEGNVYFTNGGILYSVQAETGETNWSASCHGGCLGASLGHDSVFTAANRTIDLLKFSRSGFLQCAYDSGVDVEIDEAPQIVVAGDSVVLQSAADPETGDPGRLQVLDLDCGLRFELPAPINRRGSGNPVIDLDRRRLISYWGDPDSLSFSQVFTTIYDLDTGMQICKMPRGAFRQMLADEILLHGVGAAYFDGTGPAPPNGTCDTSGGAAITSVAGVPTGDLRDMAFDATHFFVLSNPWTGWPGRLLKIDRETYEVDWMTTDFGDEFDNLANINKMGIGNNWAVVSHGRNGSFNADTWKASIIDLADGSTLGRFGRGRIHRLTHERLIDGGIFFHTSQFGNVTAPNTPLHAWRLGSGSFVGHSYMFGDERGNKFCHDCLHDLAGVEADCTAPTANDSFACVFDNRYPDPVQRIRVTSLPTSRHYVVQDPDGNILGSGQGEVSLNVGLEGSGRLFASFSTGGACGADLDDDGVSNCRDCDDGDPAIHPDAPEINDGLDNQCLGDSGYGLIDETSGNSGFLGAGDTSTYSWRPQSGATGYQVLRSGLATFASLCFAIEVQTNSWVEIRTPPRGGIFYYLNRPVGPHVGSWGADSAGFERSPPCLNGGD